MAAPVTNPPVPPAPEPGAAATTKAAPKLRYRVNWSLQGFLGKNHKAGDTVKATESEAMPFIGKALTLLDEA